MAASGSAAEKAARARRTAGRRQRDADRAARVAEAWETGRVGEVRLAEVLDRLTVDGFQHLPDRAMPASSANIDHIVVGPGGVFVLDAKAWSGALTVADGVLRQDGHRRMDAIESARTTATAVAAALDRCAPKVDVRPALCFVGEARLGESHFVEKVKLIDIDGVVAWMQQFPTKLDPAAVQKVRGLLLMAFPAKTGEPAAEVPTEQPVDLVVYLVPWKKGGRHRLYVRSTEGDNVGYLDLVTGQCSSPSPEWEAILAQLLPHYLKGDTPGMKHEDLSAEAQGVIRRFLDSLRSQKEKARPPERPIIACYRWKKHGNDRLYLSRLAPGGQKVELGSFDLDSGMLRASGPGVAATLGYCGQRFQTLEQQRLPLS